MSIKADIQNTSHFHGSQQQSHCNLQNMHLPQTHTHTNTHTHPLTHTNTHPHTSWTQLLWQQFIQHLVDSNRYSVAPINSSLLTIMLSAMKTIVCNDTKYSVPLHDIITKFNSVCVWASNIHQSHLNLNFTTTSLWWPWEGTPCGRLILKRFRNFINIYIYKDVQELFTLFYLQTELYFKWNCILTY